MVTSLSKKDYLRTNFWK